MIPSAVCRSKDVVGSLNSWWVSVHSRSEPLNEGCDSLDLFKSCTQWATIPLYSLICCACGIKKRKFPCVQKHIFLVEALSGVQDKAPWVPTANLFVAWLPINMGE